MKTFRRVVPLVAGLALLVSSSGCQWPEGTRFVDKVFDDVETTRDVVYTSTTDYQGNPIDLKLDIWQPVGDTRSERPVVMWMFGGGFVAGQKEHMDPYARDSAERGYVGVSIQYRLRPTFTIEGVVDAWRDAEAAVAWLKAHAADYRIDPDAIVSGGYSAGAVTAIHTLVLSNPNTVAGAVAIAGTTFVQSGPAEPPLLMHHGTADQIVAYADGQKVCNWHKEADNQCRFYSYQGADHYMTYQEPMATQIKERTADWIFETILWQLGYRVEHYDVAA